MHVFVSLPWRRPGAAQSRASDFLVVEDDNLDVRALRSLFPASRERFRVETFAASFERSLRGVTPLPMICPTSTRSFDVARTLPRRQIVTC